MNTITTKDGTQIFFKDWGTGQPIVFHHGWPLSGDDWENQMLFFLGKGFRVIAHDRRGHGRSSQTATGNDMDTYAADVGELAAALDLRDAVHIGHSTGGGEVTRFRGGLSRGTNFHVEINGTKGDLIITSPVGYVGLGGFKLMGASGGGPLEELHVPANYRAERFGEGPQQILALAYERLASDFLQGTQLRPTFDDAVTLHRLIDTIENSEGSSCRI